MTPTPARTTVGDAEVHVLGIRHHGPGSARSTGAALDALQPDHVLIEGPPEADAVAALAADPDLVPPVALLAYSPDDRRRAAYWPLAAFSPEWVALRWALDHDVAVGFRDLPARTVLADPPPRQLRLGDAPDDEDAPDEDPADEPDAPLLRRQDPIGALAAAAGYPDAERWWEDVVEHHVTAASRPTPETHLAVFDAIAEAMTAVRSATAPPRPGSVHAWTEARREAAMRAGIREAVKAGARRVAVVCGAWHVPALLDLPPAAHDTRLLRGLPRVKVAVTWVPWTARRLAQASGYGAGVTAPGWYHHLFTTDEPAAGWLVKAARTLRADGHLVSSAHVIDGLRLAGTLAALRDRPAVGLAELDDAVGAVLGDGTAVPVALVRDRLTIGHQIGRVPAATPQLPLQADLEAERKRLRLRQTAEPRLLDLDLRVERDRDRSRLLHRLALLGIPWGRPAGGHEGALGTFHETWTLRWDPDLDVAVIGANRWGATVVTAAEALVADRARRAEDLADLTGLAEEVLAADLPAATPAVLRALADRAAVAADVAELLHALPPLARTSRYGDVRGSDRAVVTEVLEGVAERATVGLAAACRQVDDDAATTLLAAIEGADGALGTLDRPDLLADWVGALVETGRAEGVHPLLAGRAWRILRDRAATDREEVTARMDRALSPGTEPAAAAAWIEGFLGRGGAVLVHDRGLLDLVDRWLAGIPDATFDDVLPLIRRTFATFAPGERSAIARRIRQAASGDAPAGPTARVDWDLAARAAPVLTLLLGPRPTTDGDGDG